MFERIHFIGWWILIFIIAVRPTPKWTLLLEWNIGRWVEEWSMISSKYISSRSIGSLSLLSYGMPIVCSGCKWLHDSSFCCTSWTTWLASANTTWLCSIIVILIVVVAFDSILTANIIAFYKKISLSMVFFRTWVNYLVSSYKICSPFWLANLLNENKILAKTFLTLSLVYRKFQKKSYFRSKNNVVQKYR